MNMRFIKSSQSDINIATSAIICVRKARKYTIEDGVESLNYEVSITDTNGTTTPLGLYSDPTVASNVVEAIKITCANENLDEFLSTFEEWFIGFNRKTATLILPASDGKKKSRKVGA